MNKPPAAFAVKLSRLLAGPLAAGANLMLNWQLAPTATEFPQLFVCMKGPGTLTLPSVSVPLPVLVSVAVSAALV